jgi:hypothetical protein
MRNSVTTKPNALNEMTHTQVHPSFTLDYRPSSMPTFLSRLSTFKLSTYGNKPQVIDAVVASKCGWVNDGKDRLFCSICQSPWVVVGKEGLTASAGKNNQALKNPLAFLKISSSQCVNREAKIFSDKLA